MITQPNNNPYRIARRSVKQGARPVITPQVAVEKVVTERERKKKKIQI